MSKKLLALLLCVLLMLGMAGCLEDTKQSEEAPVTTATSEPAEPAEAADTSPEDELPAFTLGDITVTVGEIRSIYNTVVEQMGYYGISVPSTAGEIKQYKDMIIEDMLTAKVLPWKAQQLGIELTPEKVEEVNRRVEEELAEYAADYLEDAKAELGDTA
ncbi:MAG: hypothetical protein IJI82_01765, partial [Clostridia bacterium]|nr:hypothetical protein [Clostridia bacterium]